MVRVVRGQHGMVVCPLGNVRGLKGGSIGCEDSPSPDSALAVESWESHLQHFINNANVYATLSSKGHWISLQLWVRCVY